MGSRNSSPITYRQGSKSVQTTIPHTDPEKPLKPGSKKATSKFSSKDILQDCPLPGTHPDRQQGHSCLSQLSDLRSARIYRTWHTPNGTDLLPATSPHSLSNASGQGEHIQQKKCKQHERFFKAEAENPVFNEQPHRELKVIFYVAKFRRVEIYSFISY